MAKAQRKNPSTQVAEAKQELMDAAKVEHARVIKEAVGRYELERIRHGQYLKDHERNLAALSVMTDQEIFDAYISSDRNARFEAR